MSMSSGLLVQVKVVDETPEISFEQVNIDNDNVLNDLYKSLECSIVEHVSLPENISIWCDEEAFVNPKFINTLEFSDGFCIDIVNNFIFLSSTEEHEIASLTESQIEYLNKIKIKSGLIVPKD